MSQRYYAAEAFDGSDTVFALPSRRLAEAVRSLALVAAFALGLWYLVTGGDNWGSVPIVLRIILAITYIAFTRKFVRDALDEWHAYRLSRLGPAVERIDSPYTSD